MGSLNKVMLIGNLGKDPEIRYTQSGSAVATFSLATTDRWTDRQGERQEKTEWHDIVAFDKLADLAQSYLNKGKSVYIEGRLQTRNWEDQNGQKRYRTEIVVNSLQFLEPRSSSENVNQQYNTNENSNNKNLNDDSKTKNVNQSEKESYIKDDIPF